MGEGSLIFSYIRRLHPFKGVKNFEFPYLGWWGVYEDIFFFFFLGGVGSLQN